MGFPGVGFFPGDMGFPGDMAFPGDMGYPARGAAERASEIAREVLGGPGWFFIVVAANEDVLSSGATLQ
ncbi:MAG: hypothetical protein AAFX09_08655 [Pseudomonadota bacterium]